MAKKVCFQLSSETTDKRFPAPHFWVLSPLQDMLHCDSGAWEVGAELPHQHSLAYSVPEYL